MSESARPVNQAPLAPLIRLRLEADVLRDGATPALARPLATELLRAQQAFNTRVVELCIDWLSLCGEADVGTLLRSMLQPEIHVEIRSHRPGLQGRLVALGKRAALRAVSPASGPWVEAQTQFNREVRLVIEQLATGRPVAWSSLEHTANEVMQRLQQLESRVPALLVWLRRQARFNEGLVRILLNHESMLIRSFEQSAARWVEAGSPQLPGLRGDAVASWAVRASDTLTSVTRRSLSTVTQAPLETCEAVLCVDGPANVDARFLQSAPPEADVWFCDWAEGESQAQRRVHLTVPFAPVLFSETQYVGPVVAVRRQALSKLPALSRTQRFSVSEVLWQAHAAGLRIAHVPGLWVSTTRAPDGAEHAKVTATYWQQQGARFQAGERPAVRFPIPPGTRASLIVPLKDRADLLKQLVHSLHAQAPGVAWELICLSNNSTEVETFRTLNALAGPQVQLFEVNQPFNWSALNNVGARHARGQVLVFLNNDVEFTQAGWLEALVGHALQPEVGPVGAHLRYPDGRLQHAGVVVGMKGLAGHVYRRFRPESDETPFIAPRFSREVSAVTGACIAIEAKKFARLGGFDEGIFVSGGDVEWCLRARALGWRVLCLANLGIVHHESLSRGASSVPAGDIAAERRAYASLLHKGDPWFHPALSTASTCAQFWLDGERAADR